MKIFKKLAAAILAGVMVLAAIPVVASAESDYKVTAKEAPNGKEVSFTLPDNTDAVYRKVTLKQAGHLVIDLSVAADMFRIGILDDSGNAKPTDGWINKGRYEGGKGNYLCRSWNSSTKKFDGKFSCELGKGTYYIELYRYGSDLLGTGKVKMTAHYYDTASTLCNAKTAKSGKSYTENLTVKGEEAVYKFNVAKTGTMKIKYDISNVYYSKYTATLYKGSDDEEVEVDSFETNKSSYHMNKETYIYFNNSYGKGNGTSTATYKVTKGTYYLRVSHVWEEEGGRKPDFTVTATYPEGSANEGKITYLSMTIPKGTTIQLGAVMSTQGAVTWTSSKASVVSVSSNGKISAKAKGSAVITAKTGKNSVKIKITVN